MSGTNRGSGTWPCSSSSDLVPIKTLRAKLLADAQFFPGCQQIRTLKRFSRETSEIWERHKMGSFHRMKEDIEEMTMQVSAKLPGKIIIWIFLAVLVLIVFVLGFGIGFSSSGSNPCSGSSCQVPVYLFLSNNSESCPALTGEKLLTTVADGQSFEGLSVLLQCKGSYLPFPTSVKCTRKKLFDGAQVLEWSNLPVCYPASLISLEYWKETVHAR